VFSEDAQKAELIIGLFLLCASGIALCFRAGVGAMKRASGIFPDSRRRHRKKPVAAQYSRWPSYDIDAMYQAFEVGSLRTKKKNSHIHGRDR